MEEKSVGVGEGGLPEELSPFPQVEGGEGEGEGDGAFFREYGKQKQKQKLRPIRSNNNNGALGFDEELGLGGFESVDELMKFKSQVDAHFMSNHFTATISNHFNPHHHLSSACSLGSDSDSDSDSDSGDKKKRRKRKRKKMESYVEELMRRVMEKQEQMQQQLMEVLQNKEKERVLREQQWRHHQMLRLNNDYHIRSQQAARSLALISFLRTTLNHLP